VNIGEAGCGGVDCSEVARGESQMSGVAGGGGKEGDGRLRS